MKGLNFFCKTIKMAKLQHNQTLQMSTSIYENYFRTLLEMIICIESHITIFNKIRVNLRFFWFELSKTMRRKSFAMKLQ